MSHISKGILRNRFANQFYLADNSESCEGHRGDCWSMLAGLETREQKPS